MNRYIRQEVLAEIGKEGQKKLKNSSVAIIGLGALGTVSSELLCRAGVGNLLLVDKDSIDKVNLQRQMLFDESDVGKKKVVVAKKKLLDINSESSVDICEDYLEVDNSSILDDYDLVLDCTDNMQARYVINNYCEKKKKLWIYAGASTTKGNVLVVDNYQKFRSIFKTGETFDACEEVGVINTITTMISSVQVTQAIKILTKKVYFKDLLRIDIWNDICEKIKI